MTISTDPAWRRARAPFRRIALALGLLLVLGSACRDSEPERAAPPPAGTPVTKAPAAQKPPPAHGPGEAEIGEGKVPESFPDDLPLYPDSRPTRYIAGGGAGSLVVFEIDGDPQVVYDFYVEKLPAAGWELENHSKGPASWLLVANKGGRKARISIASSPKGGTQLGVAVSNPT